MSTRSAVQPVLNVTLEPQQRDAQPAESTGLALVIERLAANPSVDVAKLEKVIELQERILAHGARAAFEAAFARMQPEIPEISERGRIIVKGVEQSTYAKNEDIQKVLKPILAGHGFSLSFKTEWPDKQTVRVIGVLSHIEGHSRTSEFLSGADASGNKNSIQSLGSAVSYGHRYTTKDLLNITSRYAPDGADDDGEGSEQHKAPESPAGYDEWLTDLEATADEGWPKLSKAWNESRPEFRQYLTRHAARKWEWLRERARKVATS